MDAKAWQLLISFLFAFALAIASGGCFLWQIVLERARAQALYGRHYERVGRLGWLTAILAVIFFVALFLIL